MFSLEQIKAAHSKMKSGADFPSYINEIKQLGVIGYATFVSDGHTVCRHYRKTAANSTLAIGGVSSPLDSFVVAESSVLRTNFCAKKPAHRQSANR